MIFLLRNNDSQSSAWVTCDLTDYPNSKKNSYHSGVNFEETVILYF